MAPTMPRIAALHDLSCIGRCSLTVIMPILSCMGAQVCPLPTALLSTHLGGFSQVAFCDFTEHMPGFFTHWQREGLTFDCVYSGFLASDSQIAVVSDFIGRFSDNQPLVVVDPVMGDHGKLYSVYTRQMQAQMRELVKKADVITPNYTEACFLLGEPYADQLDDLSGLREWLVRLSAFGPSRVAVTGVPLGADRIANLGYDRETGDYCEIINPYVPVRYPGTGDIFASVLIGCLLKDAALPQAIQQAVDFVAACIQKTFQAQTPVREGVLLEAVLPQIQQKYKSEA